MGILKRISLSTQACINNVLEKMEAKQSISMYKIKIQQFEKKITNLKDSLAEITAQKKALSKDIDTKKQEIAGMESQIKSEAKNGKTEEWRKKCLPIAISVSQSRKTLVVLQKIVEKYNKQYEHYLKFIQHCNNIVKSHKIKIDYLKIQKDVSKMDKSFATDFKDVVNDDMNPEELRETERNITLEIDKNNAYAEINEALNENNHCEFQAEAETILNEFANQ